MSNLLTGNFPYKTYRNINLSTTGQIAKANAGQIFTALLSNTAGSIVYVKLYDKATAPTSSDTPTHTIPLQANQTLPWSSVDGINFTTGISMRASTGVADNDNTAPAANQVIVNIEYL